MLAATNATAFAGTTVAAPSGAPGPLAPALAQPPVVTANAARSAAAVTQRLISLLCRLAPHQPGHQAGEALPREYLADPFRYRQFHAQAA